MRQPSDSELQQFRQEWIDKGADEADVDSFLASEKAAYEEEQRQIQSYSSMVQNNYSFDKVPDEYKTGVYGNISEGTQIFDEPDPTYQQKEDIKFDAYQQKEEWLMSKEEKEQYIESIREAQNYQTNPGYYDWSKLSELTKGILTEAGINPPESAEQNLIEDVQKGGVFKDMILRYADKLDRWKIRDIYDKYNIYEKGAGESEDEIIRWLAQAGGELEEEEPEERQGGLKGGVQRLLQTLGLGG